MSYLEKTGYFMSYTSIKGGEIMAFKTIIPWVNSQQIYQEQLL